MEFAHEDGKIPRCGRYRNSSQNTDMKDATSDTVGAASSSEETLKLQLIETIPAYVSLSRSSNAAISGLENGVSIVLASIRINSIALASGLAKLRMNTLGNVTDVRDQANACALVSRAEPVSAMQSEAVVGASAATIEAATEVLDKTGVCAESLKMKPLSIGQAEADAVVEAPTTTSSESLNIAFFKDKEIWNLLLFGSKTDEYKDLQEHIDLECIFEWYCVSCERQKIQSFVIRFMCTEFSILRHHSNLLGYFLFLKCTAFAGRTRWLVSALTDAYFLVLFDVSPSVILHIGLKAIDINSTRLPFLQNKT